ncbi:right-handed parallel beta-helix repeat-containing protein [Sediminibacterium sp.]|uniref:right-handed parallel beta-helix repeat-containing protein n=1 Tax=Sediminibacterium sp. TaxID=1917865 RepID=UPI0025FE24E1|nr:right-handed parallel beta-helix repeat-containing protein [Sediminibacterium sp.]MBW0178169.1 right-handed parallel beta-helix repeat-containing protein [Sediminibacterium sp.]
MYLKCLLTGLLSGFLLYLSAQDMPSVKPEKGMKIISSTRLQPGFYALNSDSSSPLIEIAGENITVDLKEVILQGSNDKTRPDEFYGVAIYIRPGSKNIHIRNANIHGYKIAILADSVDRLSIEDCDLSYNYRQELKSNREREDISDWMSYHKNENQEWKRYGAGIYLNHCKNALIANNTITGGQCGLMMTHSEKATVYNNNFSFNSGIGIGLYRSSFNTFYHNRLDWNVRGYSHGKYKRGQDSAGFLVFEQCNDNIFAYNSATHSGDGFFLWAGQHTMDTGEGGCNDNFIYGNDFSYAPTNGVEVTFSRNLVMKNIIRDCDHGIWGGYSFDSDFTDNDFAFNRIGIAIEHGQNNNIAINRFLYDKTAIKLWSRATQPADWKYAQVKDTRSMNYWIAANQFTATETIYDIMGTDTVAFSGNQKMAHTVNLKLGERTNDIDTSREDDPLDMDYVPDERLKQVPVTKRPDPLFQKGKENIRIAKWGPYNFQYPLLWLKNIDSSGLYHFEVLGKTGSWKVKELNGFEITEKGNDSFPSLIIAKPVGSSVQKNIRLQYEGPAFINQLGKEENSGTVFEYEQFAVQQKWVTRWFKWDSTNDPLTATDAFMNLLASTPIHTDTLPKLDFTWWGSIGKNLPADSFATDAVTDIETEKGFYDLAVTADDFVKIYVDGKLVIDGWDPKFTLYDEYTHHRTVIELSKGLHQIRVIHAEKSGIATLMFYFNPVKDKAQQPVYQLRISNH